VWVCRVRVRERGIQSAKMGHDHREISIEKQRDKRAIGLQQLQQLLQRCYQLTLTYADVC
jgi:hypothetical protein